MNASAQKTLISLAVGLLLADPARATTVRAKYTISYLGLPVGDMETIRTFGASTYQSGVDARVAGIATISNVRQTPSMAAVVADRVGANPAAAYDENAACAGFSYAVTQADALIRSGAAHYALVIGAEKLSDVIDPGDRSISFLLGDGAGAVVIGPSETAGISAPVWGSDGSKADVVGMNGTLTDARDGVVGGARLDLVQEGDREQHGRGGLIDGAPDRREREPRVLVRREAEVDGRFAGDLHQVP